MALQAETVMGFDPLTVGLLDIVERQEVTEDDIDRLRQTLHQPGQINQEQAKRLFETHQKMPITDGLWIGFFVEALTDYFLTREGAEIVLNDVRENQLFDALSEHVPIMDPGHRRLALRILLRATKVSDHYLRVVLDMVHHHFMHDERRLLIDLPRQPRVIDIVDLQLIRKLIFGAGGQYSSKVERAAVGFLLSLDQTALSFVDLEAWRHLLEKALSLHLAPDQPYQGRDGSQADEGITGWLLHQIATGRSGPHSTPLIIHLTKNTKDPQNRQ